MAGVRVYYRGQCCSLRIGTQPAGNLHRHLRFRTTLTHKGVGGQILECAVQNAQKLQHTLYLKYQPLQTAMSPVEARQLERQATTAKREVAEKAFVTLVYRGNKYKKAL